MDIGECQDARHTSDIDAVALRTIEVRDDVGSAAIRVNKRVRTSFARQAVAAAAPSTKRTTVAAAARTHNEEQLDAFKSQLIKLEPIHFEHFVKELLDAMDYGCARHEG